MRTWRTLQSPSTGLGLAERSAAVVHPQVPRSPATALAALGWWGIAAAADGVTASLLSKWSPETESAWWSAVVEWLTRLLLLVVKIKLTKYIVRKMGPLLAVSETVETQFTGATVSFSWGRWIKDAVRGLRSAALLATFEWSLTLMLWAVGLAVPVLSPFTLAVAWILGAWAYGASVMDYVWEREEKGAWAGLAASLRRFGLALNVGVPLPAGCPCLCWHGLWEPLMGGMGATATACVALKQPRSSSDQACHHLNLNAQRLQVVKEGR